MQAAKVNNTLLVIFISFFDDNVESADRIQPKFLFSYATKVTTNYEKPKPNHLKPPLYNIFYKLTTLFKKKYPPESDPKTVHPIKGGGCASTPPS
jgi:hypothetical protein